MSKSAYDKVTIRVKVLCIQLSVDIAPGLKQQEVTVVLTPQVRFKSHYGRCC